MEIRKKLCEVEEVENISTIFVWILHRPRFSGCQSNSGSPPSPLPPPPLLTPPPSLPNPPHFTPTSWKPYKMNPIYFSNNKYFYSPYLYSSVVVCANLMSGKTAFSVVVCLCVLVEVLLTFFYEYFYSGYFTSTHDLPIFLIK